MALMDTRRIQDDARFGVPAGSLGTEPASEGRDALRAGVQVRNTGTLPRLGYLFKGAK